MNLRMQAAVVVAMIGMCGMGWAQSASNGMKTKDDLFTGTEVFEKNASSATEVTQGPGTLDLVNGKEESQAHRTVLNVVRVYKYDKEGMFNMADVDGYRKKLDTGGWECSVHTRNFKTGESTDICDKPRTDGLKESAIIAVTSKSLTFIHTIMKRRPGDQGSVDERGAGFGGHAPNVAALDAQTAGMNAKMQVQGEAKDAEKQTMQDEDMKNPGPGQPVRLKVVRPEVEAAAVPVPVPVASAVPVIAAP